MNWLAWALVASSEGATAVMSTVAGSMVTIAGVVFSITLVALSLASNQFGPRMLRKLLARHGDKLLCNATARFDDSADLRDRHRHLRHPD